MKRLEMISSLQTLFFSCFYKIRISEDAICREKFGRFHQTELKRITNKARKKGKHICLGLYYSILRPNRDR